MEDLDEAEQSRAKDLYHRRSVHYHYVKNTEECNKLHYAALTDPVGLFRRRLFHHAGDLWEGETLALKVALMEAMKTWEMLTGGGAPCPIVFDAEDIRETMKLNAVQREADKSLEACQNITNFGPEGWVPTKHYEEAITCSNERGCIGGGPVSGGRAEITAHWPLDDMDEERYM